MIKNHFNEHLEVAKKTLESNENNIKNAIDLCINALKSGNKVLLCGNGGSAADAQHIAAELVGRYKAERRGLPAIALTTDTSAITSIGNDYGYDFVFSRQIESLANAGDVVIGISTSGTSSNVIAGLETAKKMDCVNIGFSGKNGGDMNDLCEVNIIANSDNTPRIQEMHILIGHIICEAIDDYFK